MLPPRPLLADPRNRRRRYGVVSRLEFHSGRWSRPFEIGSSLFFQVDHRGASNAHSMNLRLWLGHWRTLRMGDSSSRSHGMSAQPPRDPRAPRFDLYRYVPTNQSIKVKTRGRDLGRVAKILFKNLSRFIAEVCHGGRTSIPREHQQPDSRLVPIRANDLAARPLWYPGAFRFFFLPRAALSGVGGETGGGGPHKTDLAAPAGVQRQAAHF